MVGCFDSPGREPTKLKELLFTERDTSSKVWNGIPIDWNNWDAYMTALINRCAIKAESKGYKVFGIRYFGKKPFTCLFYLLSFLAFNGKIFSRSARSTTYKTLWIDCEYHNLDLSLLAECWGSSTITDASAAFSGSKRNPSMCVKEGYKPCENRDTRCIGKNHGVAVYQLWN